MTPEQARKKLAEALALSATQPAAAFALLVEVVSASTVVDGEGQPYAIKDVA